ncbi:recombinase family protein [Lichenicola cladoniae]|uniref:Recombinase family protein n=1 Tax=Lichenicola cladoniae TaxID=1484109 RepID=A0A6M8HUB1_9PROT|nr:recombinase family protein [Acetobacteraceae bacterium]QKE91932.1 recombinase family protein [Lichenicola cladoniae]
MIVGYARTSTADQSAGLEAQERDLHAAGAERIYAEKVSSIAQRAKLDECLRFLRDGDVLMVTKPDRLARNTAELLAIEQDLSSRGIGLILLSLGGERIDTRNPTSKLILTILAGVATWEREIMLERQREGIAKAKGQGRYLGRKQEIDTVDIWKRFLAGEQPAAIARSLSLARSSVYRHLPTAEDMASIRSHGTSDKQDALMQSMLAIYASDLSPASRQPVRKERAPRNGMGLGQTPILDVTTDSSARPDQARSTPQDAGPPSQ